MVTNIANKWYKQEIMAGEQLNFWSKFTKNLKKSWKFEKKGEKF